MIFKAFTSLKRAIMHYNFPEFGHNIVLRTGLNNIKVFKLLYYYKINSLLYKFNKKVRKSIIINFSKKANIYKIFNILNKKII